MEVFLNTRIRQQLHQFMSVISHVKNWAGYLKYKLFGGHDSFTLRLRHSFPMTMEGKSMERFYAVFQNEKYLQPLMESKPACTHPVVVDIGAGKGYFGLCAFYHFPGARVIAFEPDPSLFQALKFHASLISSWSFAACHCLIGDSDGIINFNSEARSVLVRMYRFATLRRKYKIDHIHLLKITSRQGEHQMLYHLSSKELQQIDHISMDLTSVSREQGMIDRLIRFLLENHFEVLWHPGSDKTDTIVHAKRKNLT